MEDRIAALEARLSELEDERAIAKVLADYSLALDWLDEKTLDRVFWDDADIDYGFFKGTGAEFKPILMAFESGLGRRWHFTSQLRTEIAGNEARATGYNLSLAIAAVESGDPGGLSGFFGFYNDRLSKRDGRWAISARKHILVAGTHWDDIAITGDLSALNTIGATGQHHPDFASVPISG
ncbi:nuclear transport factor 2 family protein [Croceicoccus ponticola]|uniref:Nuclear transport factor 2 family protein n=1 Tax=Croceicoccus ponticola TaxID=2217664 RepID=A0A437GVC2_9SPHN|nr:nuclear transport factor 2 family protein [Croceicoccus ponticola]RVQ65711.1 nuclear transport factor 2 family protein [Croceicoccus ponticola]